MSDHGAERQNRLERFLTARRGRLIVSCQALPDEPLYGSAIMARMALAAQQGGACAIRANTPEDIRAIAPEDLPIIGPSKAAVPGYDVYITPTLADVQAVVAAGADLIAIDATQRPRPEFADLTGFIQAIHAVTACPVLADISTFGEATAAVAAGADLVSTTLSGYTPYSPDLPGPDLPLARELTQALHVPLLAEGRYHTPEQVAQARALGRTPSSSVGPSRGPGDHAAVCGGD